MEHIRRAFLKGAATLAASVVTANAALAQEGSDMKLSHSSNSAERPAPFSLSEIAIVDWWIDHIATYETAESISQKSHDYTWQIAAMGEELPMVATFARRIRAPSEEETRLAKETAAKLGLP